MKWWWQQKSSVNIPSKRAIFLFFFFVLTLINTCICYGQKADPLGGIAEATKQVSGYFGNAVYLMYAIGALAGIVGAVKTFNQWNSGDPHATKTAAAWFGSCLFLVVVASVLKLVFGIA
jgi:hypothetical protein